MNHYRSEASPDRLDKALRDALHRLLACARRVESLARYRAARGGAGVDVPATYEVVNDHVQTAYRRLRMWPVGKPRRGSG